MVRSHILLGGAVAFAGLVFLAPTADARGIGAAAGRATAYSDLACFANPYGEVTMAGCTGKHNWQTALTIDSPGSFNPAIYNTFNFLGGGWVSCSSFAISSNGTVSSSGYTTGSANPLVPGSVSVPSNGFLFVGCDLTYGGTGQPTTLYTITW